MGARTTRLHQDVREFPPPLFSDLLRVVCRARVPRSFDNRRSADRLRGLVHLRLAIAQRQELQTVFARGATETFPWKGERRLCLRTIAKDRQNLIGRWC